MSLSQGTAGRLYNVGNLEEGHKNLETAILLNTLYTCLCRSRSSGGQQRNIDTGTHLPVRFVPGGGQQQALLLSCHTDAEKKAFVEGRLSLSVIKNKSPEMETCPLRKVLRLMGTKAARGV